MDATLHNHYKTLFTLDFKTTLAPMWVLTTLAASAINQILHEWGIVIIPVEAILVNTIELK